MQSGEVYNDFDNPFLSADASDVDTHLETSQIYDNITDTGEIAPPPGHFTVPTLEKPPAGSAPQISQASPSPEATFAGCTADTRLLDCCRTGDEAGVIAALKDGASPTTWETGSLCGTKKMAQFIAAEAGHHLILQLLVKMGADVNATDSRGWSVAMIAARSGKMKVLEWLGEDGGANLCLATAQGETALTIACRYGHLAVVQYLVQSGLYNIDKIPSVGAEALDIAAENGMTEVVTFLLGAGCDLGHMTSTRPGSKAKCPKAEAKAYENGHSETAMKIQGAVQVASGVDGEAFAEFLTGRSGSTVAPGMRPRSWCDPPAPRGTRLGTIGRKIKLIPVRRNKNKGAGEIVLASTSDELMPPLPIQATVAKTRDTEYVGNGQEVRTKELCTSMDNKIDPAAALRAASRCAGWLKLGVSREDADRALTDRHPGTYCFRRASTGASDIIIICIRLSGEQKLHGVAHYRLRRSPSGSIEVLDSSSDKVPTRYFSSLGAMTAAAEVDSTIFSVLLLSCLVPKHAGVVPVPAESRSSVDKWIESNIALCRDIVLEQVIVLRSTIMTTNADGPSYAADTQRNKDLDKWLPLYIREKTGAATKKVSWADFVTNEGPMPLELQLVQPGDLIAVRAPRLEDPIAHLNRKLHQVNDDGTVSCLVPATVDCATGSQERDIMQPCPLSPFAPLRARCERLQALASAWELPHTRMPGGTKLAAALRRICDYFMDSMAQICHHTSVSDDMLLKQSDPYAPGTLGGVGIGYFRIRQGRIEEITQQDHAGRLADKEESGGSHRVSKIGNVYFKPASLDVRPYHFFLLCF